MEKVGELTVTGGQKALLKGVDAMLEESNRVVAVADQAYKLVRDKDKGLQRPEGMSEEEFNIASDALSANKDCPTYLREHYERLKLQMRIVGGHGDGGAPLIQFIQNVFQPPKYETIDVTPVDK
jgi:hypothetical protein